MKNLWTYFCYFALAILLVLSTLHFFRTDLFYETDIARDMLLLQDMVDTHKLSFIGGRSSIPGVFHGPLYYWLLLPVFVLSGGNPVALSYVWFVFYWLSVFGLYYVGKKTVNQSFGLTAATLFASVTTFLPVGYTHATVAVFLIAPLIFLTSQYSKTKNIRWLLADVVVMGLLIQFQMAVGVPVLILFGAVVLYQIVKNKNFTHLLAFLALALPLSTFAAFDLRHEFIQTKSVSSYLITDSPGSINGYWQDRGVAVTEAFRLWQLPNPQLWKFGSWAVAALLFWLGWRGLRQKEQTSAATFILLNLLLVFGFWLVTSPFKGNIWPQYYRVLLPGIVFGVSYVLLQVVPKKIGYVVLLVLVGTNLWYAVQNGIRYIGSQPTDDEIHWKFYRQMTSDIFADSQGQTFGYYVFSPDQYGYQGKYAMRYFSKHVGVSTTPYQKQPLTYLVIAPNDHTNPWANEDFWQTNQVKIDRSPDKEWSYPAGYQVRRFDLNEAEVATASESTLLDGIHFR